MGMKFILSIFFLAILGLSEGWSQRIASLVSEGEVPTPYQIGYGYKWAWKGESVYDTAWLKLCYKMKFWDQEKTSKLEDYRIVYLGKGGFRKDVSYAIEECERRLSQDSGLFFGRYFYPMEWDISPEGKSVCLFRLALLRQMFLVEFSEPEASFDWKLSTQVDSVCGFVCQMAQTDYLGRKYEAWFCPEIPVDIGPFKFRGLPGLIVKVKDMDGDYSWELYEGMMQEVDIPMVRKTYMSRKTSRGKARSLIEDCFNRPYPYTIRSGRNVKVRTANGYRELTGEELEISIFFTPIELE